MLARRPFAAALALALIAPVTAMSTSTTASAAQTPAAKKVAVKDLPRPTRDRATTPEHDPHTVLVKFKKSATKATRDKAVQSRGGRSAEQVPGTGFVKVRATGAAGELASRLSADPSVAQVTLDYIRETSATPNDYFYSGTHEQEYLKTVRMPGAWDRSKGSLSQVVAVIDTGVNGQHPDLTGRTVAGFNAITNVGIAAGAASDDYGHGSMVAGIIAAETNNSEGIAGVAWNARVMPVKVLNSQGRGTDSDIIQGIKWAADHGAKILNLSLGGPADSPALHDAVTYAKGKGALVIVAAGNTAADRPTYPAAYSEAVAVAATDNAGRLTDFSTHGSWVDLAAPGWDILSTGRRDADGYIYFSDSGTSFAAPIVAGIAVLIRTQNPSFTAAQITARLRSTARDAGPRGTDPFYGAGIVDATNALGGGWAADFPQPSAGPNEPNDVPARALAIAVSETWLPSATGVTGVEGDVDWYRFSSPSLQQMTVAVTPPGYNGDYPQNLDPILSVYDTDLKLIGEVDDHEPGLPESLTLTTGKGTYYVAVRSYNGALDTRSYDVKVSDTGRGIFDPTVTHDIDAYEPRTSAVGDVTGDGRPDVVIGIDWNSYYPTSTMLWVLPGKSDGTLDTARSYATAEGSLPRTIDVVDVDDDGDQDLVAVTGVGLQVLRQSAGELTAAEVVPGTAGTSRLAVADVDGDGRSDLVTVQSAILSDDTLSAHIALLNRQEDGSYTSSTVGPESSVHHFPSVAVGDVDGDGRLDIVTHDSNDVVVRHNTTTGWTTTTHRVSDWMGGSTGLALVDTDLDGRLDVVALTPDDYPHLVVLLQGADGTLTAGQEFRLDGNLGELELADYDGDGHADIVHVGTTTYVSVLTTSTSGLRLLSTAMGPYGNATLPGRVSTGDVTGDGRDDVVMSYQWGAAVMPRSSGGVTPSGEQLWVRSTTPNDFGSGMTLTYTPTVTFARDVVPSSVTTSTVRVLNGRTGSVVPAAVTYDAAKRVATIKPTTPLYDNAPYRLLVSGVKDTSGATMGTAYTSTFRTADIAPPAAGGFKATGALRAATLTWTAPHINDLDRYIVRMAVGSTPPSSVAAGTAVYSGTGTSAKVNLAQGTTYTFRIWVRDRSGRYSPAPSVRLVGTAETMASNRTSVTYGGSVTLSSKLIRKDSGAAISGVPVQLYWRRVGSSTWNLTATRTSSSTGTVSFVHKPTASVDYMWIYRGSTAYVGSSSALRRVTVVR